MTVETTTTPVLDVRVHPSPRARPTTGPIPLVCVPAVSMPNAAGLVFYDAEAAGPLRDLDALRRSLGAVLASYPQLAGRLRLTQPGDEGRPYAKRYKRTWMSSGHDNDPGVRFTVVDDARSLVDVLPAPLAGHAGVYTLDAVYDLSLGPELVKPIADPGRGDGGDGATAGVKITRFADGAAALCFASSHALFDAGALGTFLHDWTAVHTSLARGEDAAPPSRPFDTEALDALAAGDLDADGPDPALVEAEAALDVFRYDSWARDPEGKDNPPAALDTALAPPAEVDALDAASGRQRGTPPPWHTAGAVKPLTYGLEFSAADVERIHAATLAARTTDDFVSPQDALAAHLFRLIARARQHAPDTKLDFEVACDDRRRFDPPLPTEAPGCFNVCLGFNLSAGDVQASDGRLATARRIRSAIAGVTAPRLAAWLHRRAHDLDPTREWIVFPGNTTVCSTNWARSALYAADFGAGRPCYVHNLVHGFGGYLVIGRKAVPRGDGFAQGKWYEPGVFVSLWLEEPAMSRLVADPELRG
ncbi:hypothetical protein Q8F55_003298 [Vanrija albida]|uniref:Transferase family protein n=1 Tax=Vanrija albida TaxID=181172 RepID=A0ABR3Q3Y0_9TREE